MKTWGDREHIAQMFGWDATKENPNHEPAGSPIGGQFARASGTVIAPQGIPLQNLSDEAQARIKHAVIAATPYEVYINSDGTIYVHHRVTSSQLGTLENLTAVQANIKLERVRLALRNAVEKEDARSELGNLKNFPIRNQQRIEELEAFIAKAPELPAEPQASPARRRRY